MKQGGQQSQDSMLSSVSGKDDAVARLNVKKSGDDSNYFADLKSITFDSKESSLPQGATTTKDVGTKNIGTQEKPGLTTQN